MNERGEKYYLEKYHKLSRICDDNWFMILFWGIVVAVHVSKYRLQNLTAIDVLQRCTRKYWIIFLFVYYLDLN